MRSFTSHIFFRWLRIAFYLVVGGASFFFPWPARLLIATVVAVAMYSDVHEEIQIRRVSKKFARTIEQLVALPSEERQKVLDRVGESFSESKKLRALAYLVDLRNQLTLSSAA